MEPSDPSTAAAGPHRSGLHRRPVRPPGRETPGADAQDTRALSLHGRSLRGELWFRLQHHQGGLYVEREEIPRRGLRQLQSMHFREVRDFERWCDDDPARFEHPRLHVDLKRDASVLWQFGNRSGGDG
jgi:hypothetical protein